MTMLLNFASLERRVMLSVFVLEVKVPLRVVLSASCSWGNSSLARVSICCCLYPCSGNRHTAGCSARKTRCRCLWFRKVQVLHLCVCILPPPTAVRGIRRNPFCRCCGRRRILLDTTCTFATYILFVCLHVLFKQPLYVFSEHVEFYVHHGSGAEVVEIGYLICVRNNGY